VLDTTLKNISPSNSLRLTLQFGINLGPWCPIWKEMHDSLNFEQSHFQNPEEVLDHWFPTSKNGMKIKITSLFGHVLVCIPIISRNKPDIICSKLGTSGICSSRTSYGMLAVKEASRHSPSNIHVQVLYYKFSNRYELIKQFNLWVKTFAWRLMRLALRTASRICKIVPNFNETFSPCTILEVKTSIFHCNFSSAVWFASPIGLRVHVLPS
jgi:hypothetical protein